MIPTRARFIVLSGLCGAAALAYFVRNGVASAESTIRADLGITKEESGLMMSMFFWPYALCQIPAAMLAMRIGSRWALALYGCLWSLATAGMALGQLGLMTISRGCMGAAQAGLVPVAVGSMSKWFPKAAQASASGAFSGSMSVGSIIAAPLTAWLVVNCGWKWMFVIFAVPGVLWAAWFAWWHREMPAEHPAANEAERELIGRHEMDGDHAKSAATWRLLITSPVMWLLCLQQFCRAAGYIFFASWFATYLQEARGVTILKSGWLTALPLMADVAGCMTGGLLSDAVLRRSGRQRLARQGLIVMVLLLCAGLIFGARLAADPLAAVLIISAGMFFAGMANPCYSATLMAFGGRQAAAVSAVTNMCGNFGAASFPILVPWMLANAGGWDAVLIGFGSLYIIAAAFWAMMRMGGNAAASQPRPANQR